MSGLRARQVLGGLWCLDGLLQLQPGMFRMAMVQAVLQPAAVGEPRWLQVVLGLVAGALARHLVLGNLVIAAIQLGIGAALLLWPDRLWPGWASLVWSALLWVGGQGLGGLLSGEASLLAGAPGSAVLYALLTWAAWPGDGGSRRRRVLTGCLGALWALGALLQLQPVFFGASGLGGLVAGNAAGQPAGLTALLTAAGAAAGRWAAPLDAVLALAMAASAAGIWAGGWARRPALALSLALAALAWVFAQGVGMLGTGMATDPNSAPLLAVLALYAWDGAAAEPAAAAAG